MRDMTQKQFKKACEERGFKPEGFLGYYSLPNGMSASILNAGKKRRAQLTYLIKMSKRQKRGNSPMS